MATLYTVGLDLHSRSFTLACLDEKGKTVRRAEMPTSEKNLREAVRKLPKPRVLVLEESHMAQWGKDTLETEVDQLIVCDPKRNKWISHDDHVDDAAAALRLAKLFQGGNIRPIVHPNTEGAALRGLFLHYHDLTRHESVIKMKIKGIFRGVAVVPAHGDPNIYNTEHKEFWLDKLTKWPHIRFRAEAWYDQLDAALKAQKAAFRRVTEAVMKDPRYAALQTIPGVAAVTAPAYLCLIGEARRFSRKNKLWSYAGLGNKRHDSGGKTYSNEASVNGCRPLKAAVFRQFKAAVRQTEKCDNRFKRQYQQLLEKGTAWRAARRQVCRSMLSVARAMLIEGGNYQDTHQSVQKMHAGMN